MRRLSTLLVTSIALLLTAPGCEAIDKVKGVATLMEAAGEHLEEDLKAELTDEKIDLFLAVTPRLKEFSETAKVKWKPNPEANDFSQMSTSIGALGDYAAFFESEGTRITEYWVLTIKIYDAWAVLSIEDGEAEARKRLADEKAELEKKKAAASGDEAAKLEKELERNAIALGNLDKVKEAAEKHKSERKDKDRPYALTEAEIERVRARKDEIKKTLEDAEYIKKSKTSDEPKE